MVAFGLIVVLVLTIAVPADALNRRRPWGQLDLYISGVLQGKGYGTWRVADTSNGTRSLGEGYVQDSRPSGSSVYFYMHTQANAGSCISPQYTSCSQPWFTVSYKDSQHSNSDRWVTVSASSDVASNGNAARARIQLCEERRFYPDSCTGWDYTDGDNY
jgi:hypothetical protein